MMHRKHLVAVGSVLTASVVLAGCGGTQAPVANAQLNAGAKQITLSITANAISGGKNAEEADWMTKYVIPQFEAAQKKKGVDAKVTFDPNGVDDAPYKTKISLALNTGGGADVISIDGIWVGEFADAGYIKPLNTVVGKDVAAKWSGWSQIKPAVQQVMTYQNNLYGIPDGTDGRVIYFNKNLFKQAGLPTDWQPQSWSDIISAAQKLKSLPGVTPLQINAGSAMGEATTMQGVLPLLVGTGSPILKNGKWQGDSAGLTSTLDLYAKIYGAGKLGDPQLQQAANGRDQSFAAFAKNKLGIIIESDYLWRSVINPSNGTAPMANRDTAVGWAKIPAESTGTGVNGQNFVSMSGGSGEVLNPKTKYPQQAFELMTFMNSAAAVKARLGNTPQVTARDDVNSQVLASDPLLSFIAKDVLPITIYRPSLSDYTKVSTALQNATDSVVNGTSAGNAAKTYEKTLEGIVGAGNVFK